MTTFASWLGVDSRGSSSVYIATDSRISWETSVHWDHGRKVFTCQTSPQIFGYAGDVVFPSLALGQICESIDAGLLFATSDSLNERIKSVEALLIKIFEAYPKQKVRDFEIGYATRVGESMISSFHFVSFKWTHQEAWTTRVWPIPTQSDTIALWGSGAPIVEKWKGRWNKSSQKCTSRAMFGSVCDAIYSGEDEKSGGAPQVVGLFRKGNGKTFGFCDHANAYVNGMPLARPALETSLIEWRNRAFERCQADGSKIEKAQEHHTPKGLGGIKTRVPKS